jgi:endoglucanase
MLLTSGFANSPTEIRSTIENLVGTSNADQLDALYRARFVQRKDIDSLARWGFNSVRLPMHFNLLSSSPGVYLEEGFTRIDSLLNWCAANQLYLILDLHCAPGGQNSINISDYQGFPSLWESPDFQTWTAEIWKTIAARYASRPWIGGFDILNETAWSFSGGNTPLRNLLVRITDGIRTVDRNHLIFAEGNRYATDFSNLTPAWDANMAWSFHKYWNTNDYAAFQSFLNLCANTNTPLWMGESGENANQFHCP